MSEPYWEPLAAAPAPTSLAWQTGDYKISAQAATHADPAGGTWYLCDGSATVGAALIALLGATLPDSVGRSLVMKGTHADNNAIGKSDGDPTKANRRNAHNHSVVQPAISKPAVSVTQPTLGQLNDYVGGGGGPHYVPGSNTSLGGVSAALASNPVATGGTVGPQAAGTPVDQGSFIVPGNLFVHS